MKNIVLCADGTGNKGGSGDDSNVYKLYNAVDRRPAAPGSLEQIPFYDNGVGTQDSSIIRSLSGALGLGFQANVRDLYEFLAKNYDPGDRIYVFGFSRGAATARAFTGMIQWCGLLNKNNFVTDGLFDEKKFQKAIDEAMVYYQKSDTGDASPGKYDPYKDQSGRKHWDSELIHGHGTVKIHCLGVWDTVSALGFPRNFSPAWGSWFKALFAGVEWISNKLKPHQFYDYQSHQVVENVYHALAIDDERSTFHPVIWDERPNLPEGSPESENIEQVWFAGAHSNVGGGYPRAGLSDVALEWMMTRAKQCGLRYIPGIEEEIYYRTNVHGELYDSRAGFGVFYRYGPRDLSALCQLSTEKPLVAADSINIHQTVIDRMERTTDGYAPRVLPDQFRIT